MKFKSVLLLAVAIGCGLVAMLGVQQVLSKDEKAPEKMGSVLVALGNISPGTPLNESNVAFKEMPKTAVPQGAVTRPEEFEERALRSSAVEGEFIMLAKLGERGAYGASSDIPEGMAVATVPVNMTKTHSGLMQPGDRVDILVTFKERTGGRQLTKTETILEYVEVFATDAVREAGGEGAEVNAKNVSFLMTREHASVLMTAEQQGQLSLLLRPKSSGSVAYAPKTQFNSNEPEPSEGEEGGIREFLEQEEETPEAEVAQEPAKPMWQMVIYSGGEPETQEFELEEEDLQSDRAFGEGGSSSWMEFLQRFLTGA